VSENTVPDFNAEIINEFRANEGRVGGPFEGAPILLLHHIGAKSGTERINPVVYQPMDNGYAIFASKAGADTNPDWYHNLVANPHTSIEVGTAVVRVTSRVADAAEREPIWSAQKAAAPGFAEYERKTTRQIPVVILEPNP
jgi:deazaflavin-dependent oxidoreductase (nitroreductase family)